MSEREREGGFIVILRRVQSSELWRSLRADQRGVLVSLLLLANYRPKVARWHGVPYEVRRGELSHSLVEIAEHANASVKVVRTTIAVLQADDRQAGGNGPFLTERYPIPGTEAGTGPRVLTIVKYDEYQRVPDGEGTGSGADRAQGGRGPGTDRAEREPGEPREPVNLRAVDEVFEELRRFVESHLPADVWSRWFAPLRGRRQGAVLVVEAPDKFHRDFVEDNYRAWLEEVLDRELYQPLSVKFLAAPSAATGGV